MPRVPVGFSQASLMSLPQSGSPETTTAHGTEPCNELNFRCLWLNDLREAIPFSSDTTWGRYVPRIAAAATGILTRDNVIVLVARI